MRYAVVGKLENGTLMNLFADGRSFKSKAYAKRLMNERSFYVKEELDVVEVEDFTDTERLDFMIENRYHIRIQRVGGGHPGSKWAVTGSDWFDSPREAIDSMMRSK